MAQLIKQFQPIVATDGQVYSVQACGAETADGLWEGWLAFFMADGTALHTPRETVQPDADSLTYWASGLGPLYLDGALARAVPTTGVHAVTEPAAADFSLTEAIPAMFITALPPTQTYERIVRGEVVGVNAARSTLQLRSGRYVLEFRVARSDLSGVAVGQLVSLLVSGDLASGELSARDEIA